MPSTVPLPIAQWHLDGNANDSIGTNNGTATNVTWQQGKVNEGAIFDTTSKILFSNPISFSSHSDFSITSFVNYAAPKAVLFAYGTGGGTYLGATDLGTRIYSNVGGVEYYFDFQQELNRWFFITHVFSSGNLRVYINGVESTSGAQAVVLATMTINFISGYSYGYNLNGMIDEVCCFDYALSPTQVADLNTYYNS